MKDLELWNKIQAFELDAKGSEFNFTQRLARDNDWSLTYSSRVIDEYKKFIYLCCCDYGQITPSDAVDQAWHLHLTYTKSYWIDLCRKTLQREVHHNPTQGGSKEASKYSNCYDAIIEVYELEFNQKPPKEIWPSNEQRFTDINFKRINISNYWLIEKRKSKYAFAIPAVLLSTVGLFMQSKDSFPWGAFIVVAIAVIIVIRVAKGNKKRKRGRRRRGRSSSGSDIGLWTGFWGCSSDSNDSGCSSSGCGGGGCGGGGD